MYKANENSSALTKALYSTNRSFRTCAKVMYTTPIKALYFPRPIVEGAGNHTGGYLEYDIVSCV